MDLDSITPEQVMSLHLAALYNHDDRGRITGINQWNGGIAPRFHLGRTRGGIHWRVRADVPEATAAALAALCRRENPGSRLERLPERYDSYLRILEHDAPVDAVWSGPAYRLGARMEPVATTRQIDLTNASLLVGGLDDWVPDIGRRHPFMAAIADGRAVAVCASARMTDAAHEAGVETLPAYRRRGHAAAAVASWAQAVERLGALPLYSTSWRNTASRRLAAHLGFSLYGIDFHIT